MNSRCPLVRRQWGDQCPRLYQLARKLPRFRVRTRVSEQFRAFQKLAQDSTAVFRHMVHFGRNALIEWRTILGRRLTLKEKRTIHDCNFRPAVSARGSDPILADLPPGD